MFPPPRCLGEPQNPGPPPGAPGHPQLRGGLVTHGVPGGLWGAELRCPSPDTPHSRGTGGLPSCGISSEDFPVLEHPCSASSPPGWEPGPSPACGTREGAGTPKTLSKAGASAPTEPPVPPRWAGPCRRRDPDLPPTLPWHRVAAAPRQPGVGPGWDVDARHVPQRAPAVGSVGTAGAGQGSMGRGQRAGVRLRRGLCQASLVRRGCGAGAEQVGTGDGAMRGDRGSWVSPVQGTVPRGVTGVPACP